MSSSSFSSSLNDCDNDDNQNNKFKRFFNSNLSIKRRERCNFQLIENFIKTPEEIVRDDDVDSLELFLDLFINADFSSSSSIEEEEEEEEEDDVEYRNRKKMFVMKYLAYAQLLVEYLLNVQDVLVDKKNKMIVREQKLKFELETWVKRAKEERERRKLLLLLQQEKKTSPIKDNDDNDDDDTNSNTNTDTNDNYNNTNTNNILLQKENEDLKRKLEEKTIELERSNKELVEKNIIINNNNNKAKSLMLKEKETMTAASAAVVKTREKVQYSGKLSQEVRNLLVRVGAKSEGKLSDRNTTRSFEKLKEIIELESNSKDRSVAERRKYQETSRNLHLVLINGESFQSFM